MPQFLNDQFNRGGFINGSTASPTGGTWSPVTTGFGTTNLALDGASLDFGNGSGTPFFVKNSATPSSADQTISFEFTPTGDDWVVFALFRVSGSDSAYQFVVSPGGGTCYTRTASDTWVGTQIGAVSTEVLIPASNRTSHTVVCSVTGNVFAASIDGTTLAFGGTPPTDTSNFLTAAGVVGIGGRSAKSSWITGDTPGGGDTTPPTLTSPTGTSTGTTTASGTVSTNEANGTLYRLASTNATELAATVKAAALSQAVTATGSQAVSFTGLSPSTTYYAHYVHTDAAGNDSSRVSSASFTTAASGDTTPPTLTSPTGTSTGATTATGTVTTNEANGTLYYVTTVNATETATTVKAGSSQAVTATGVQNVSRTGLTASTTYRHHFLHRDAAGNDSAVSSSATFTTSASSGGTLTLTAPLCNNTGLISGRWASATGIRLSIVNESTGATVAVITGRATDSSGVLTAAVTDAAIAPGQTYRILPSWSGNAGLSQVLTAT